MSYQNCWIVVRTNSEASEQHKTHKKATALMILEYMTRETLEQGPVPGTVSLLWYDDGGEEHLLTRVEIADKFA